MKTYKYKIVIEGYVEAIDREDAMSEIENMNWNDIDSADISIKKDNDYTKNELGYVGMKQSDFI